MAKVRYWKSKEIWRMDAMHEGTRKTFYSKEKSERKAQADCDRQFFLWVDDKTNSRSIRWLDAWEEYMDDYAQRWKSSSAREISERGRVYLVPKFKNKKLDDIKKLDYQRIIDSNKHLAKKTLEGISTTISSFGKFCVKKGYLEDDRDYTDFLIPAKASVKTKRALHPKELQVLMSPEVESNWYVPMFRFLVFTGLRRGELCTLQTERDFKPPYLYVRETISNELVLGTPKNGKEREEYISDMAMQAIRLHRQNRANRGIESKYLFCSVRGQRLNPKVLSDAWRKYRAEHALGDITLHELRHTFSSYASKNVDLDTLKEMLGHSEYMDTMGTYVHATELTAREKALKEQMDKENASKVEEVFKFILEL